MLVNIPKVCNYSCYMFATHFCRHNKVCVIEAIVDACLNKYRKAIRIFMSLYTWADLGRPPRPKSL